MQRLEVSGAVRPLYGSLGVKGLNHSKQQANHCTRPRQPEECVELYSLQNYFVVSSLQLETGTVRFNPLTQGLI
jgi:hypothetical protein